MKKTNPEKLKSSEDKTNWKKIFNSSQSSDDIAASKDAENPVLTQKKFVKSKKTAKNKTSNT